MQSMSYIGSIDICCATFPLLVPMLCCVFEEVCLSIKILCDIVSINIVYDIVYYIVYDIVYDILYDIVYNVVGLHTMS